ncbi:MULTISPECIES: hypothetical protein [Rodentibacter]|nr:MULTISPECIES: hypothetical protein [Rodentibacter]
MGPQIYRSVILKVRLILSLFFHRTLFVERTKWVPFFAAFV